MMVYVYLYGRLGNNLAQIGAAATLAAKLNCDFAAIPIVSYWCPEPDNCYLNDYLRPFKQTIFRKINFLDAPSDNYIEIHDEDISAWEGIKIEQEKDILLNGYFLNAQLIDRAICQRLFEMPVSMLSELVLNYKISVSTATVVVRRGDYLNLPHQYAICGRAYYNKAMKFLEQRYDVKHWLVISDDIKWCRKVFKGDKFTLVDEPPLIDLYLPTLCSYNIISNSTFAWWGAYLNSHENQLVCFPNPWYGWSYQKREKTIVDFFCNQKGWISIENFDIFHRLRGLVYYMKHVLVKYMSKIKGVL